MTLQDFLVYVQPQCVGQMTPSLTLIERQVHEQGSNELQCYQSPSMYSCASLDGKKQDLLSCDIAIKCLQIKTNDLWLMV